MSHTTYRILSCDGGGIRGVITAKLLQALDPSVIKNIDLFAGTSTGANLVAAIALGRRLGPDATIVTVMCDSGLKYLSTDLYPAK